MRMISQSQNSKIRHSLSVTVFASINLLFFFGCLLASPLLEQNKMPSQASQIFPEHNQRDEWQKPVEILEALDLKSGDIVADIGSGAGYFTGWLSQAVGSRGWIYAVDISEEAIRLLNEKVEFYPIKNITPVLCTESDLRLPPHSLDTAFLMNTFSVVKKKDQMLSNVMTALKSRGRLIIIDWRATKEGPLGPPRAERLPEEKVIQNTERAGFKLLRKHDLLPSQYFLEFVKDTRRRN